jgi:hypothetical protein
MTRLLLAWLFLTVLAVVWNFGAHRKPAHEETVGHRHSMNRAQLWLDAADHWDNHELARRRFIAAAYQVCASCGCPADMWPVAIVR